MTDLMDRPLVPIAGTQDAEATYEAIAPYLDPATTVVVVNVIEKAGGGIDKASVEQRREIADEAFAAFQSRAAQDGVSVETEVRYGTDIAETIEAAADDLDATSIAFVARGGGRIVEFLSGSVRTKLTVDNEFPVLVLPRDREE